jgi:hypothetical protein
MNKLLYPIFMLCMVGVVGCEKLSTSNQEKIAISCSGTESVYIRLNDKQINNWNSPISEVYIFDKLPGKSAAGNAIWEVRGEDGKKLYSTEDSYDYPDRSGHPNYSVRISISNELISIKRDLLKGADTKSPKGEYLSFNQEVAINRLTGKWNDSSKHIEETSSGLTGRDEIIVGTCQAVKQVL